MVVETEYYDLLGVKPTASALDIKKAYRKLAITTHPDKNPGDETAHARFQAIGEAYQILSNDDLRAAYDRYGKEKAQPDAGFEDPSEFFSMIFGGDAFVDIIGELTLLKDMMHQVDVASEGLKDEQLAEQAQQKMDLNEKKDGKAAAAGTAGASAPSSAKAKEAEASAQSESKQAPPPPAYATTAAEPTPAYTGPAISSSGTSTPRRQFGQQTIMEKSEEEARMDAAGLTEEEKELQRKKKKGGLTKEQREKLEEYERERQRAREARVATLTRKLIDRLSIWTEMDKRKDVTHAFEEKTRLEAENLKMESFGVEILHAVGQTYTAKATSFLKSQKFLGISGFFSRLKEKGTLAKETWTTISTAIDAQLTMEEMAKLEEAGGADWTDEKKAEYERKVMGKILAAAWRGSKFEIQGVLRDVCDRVLNDKRVKLEKRVDRANALLITGAIYLKVQRDADEEGDFMAFEQLMAESMKKQEKKDKKKDTPTKADKAAKEAESKSAAASTTASANTASATPGAAGAAAAGAGATANSASPRTQAQAQTGTQTKT